MRILLTTPRLQLLLAPPGWRGVRRVALLLLLVLLLLLSVEVVRVVLGSNSHWAIPNQVLRTAQLSNATLEATIRKFGIKTVVNLRGCSNPMDWYLGEASITHGTNTSQEDITLSAYRFPPPQEIQRLIEVLDQSEQPILLHCRRGADRTGLASAVAILLQEGSTLEAAKKQVSLRYGHFNFMHAGRMDDFLAFYEAYLSVNEQEHTPQRFRDWVAQHYSPGPGLAGLQLLDHKNAYPLNRSIAVMLRAKNQSGFPWQFKPGTFAGIHARFLLVDSTGKVIYQDRAGLFERVVAPGESIDLLIGLPPLRTPGNYTLMIDMSMDQAVSFMQLGSEPIYATISIRD